MSGQWKVILLIKKFLEVEIILEVPLDNGVRKGDPCSVRGLASVSNIVSQSGFRIALYL